MKREFHTRLPEDGRGINGVEYGEYGLVGHVPLAGSREATIERDLDTIHGQILDLSEKHLGDSHRSYSVTTARPVTDLVDLLDRVHHSC